MRESGYYPPGAEFDPNAPYNQVELPERDVDITITLTISKTIKVSVNDYNIEREETDHGYYDSYDYSDCNVDTDIDKEIDKLEWKKQGWEIDDLDYDIG